MHIRVFSATLALTALIASACSDGKKEESPGEVLARDSSLASDLKQADTSAFAEAADVAMAFDPDSVLPPVGSTRPARAAEQPPAAVSTPSAAPMRVDRSVPVTSPAPVAPAAPATAPAPARRPMRPVPATIHPDPLPSGTLPPAPPRRVSPAVTPAPPSGAGAAAILAKVPGAALPPVGSDEPCSSAGAASQRRCLMLHLARSDLALDRTYRSLIADLKREAGARSGTGEPESVQQLRVAQRAWLVYRDTECRRRNRGREGPLWAPMRAQCLGEFSGTRTEELALALRERQGR